MHTQTSSLDVARAFSRELTDLLRREQGAMVEFLLALCAFDEQRLWAQLGFATLFDFLHRELKLSKSAAYYRNAAVTLVRKHPEVAQALSDGKLCLSTIGELAKVLTRENLQQILPRFFHLSAREARELVAELAPRAAPAVREVVTTVRAAPVSAVRTTGTAMGASEPVGRVATSDLAALTSGNLIQVSGTNVAERVDVPPPVPHPFVPARGEQVEPLTTDLRRLHLTVSKQWVMERDDGKCQFKLHDGTICGSRVRLQLDHVQPRALGGPATIDNVRVLCASHNDEAARRVFGDEWMDLFRNGARRVPGVMPR